MQITTDTLVGAAGGFVLFGSAFGVVWKLLKPWMREQLADPLGEVHNQVTQNHHVSDPPTMVDRIDSLHAEFAEMRLDFQALVGWKAEENRKVDARLDRLEDALIRRPVRDQP